MRKSRAEIYDGTEGKKREFVTGSSTTQLSELTACLGGSHLLIRDYAEDFSHLEPAGIISALSSWVTG
jgi:hypothetical protein